MVRYHIVCIHLSSDKLRIDGVGVVIAGQPTDTYKEFLPIEHLNYLLSKGHTCYFVNKGIAMEVWGFCIFDVLLRVGLGSKVNPTHSLYFMNLANNS